MELSKNTFNKLVELLNYNALNNSQIGAEANTLKEKLLKYSIPKEDENGKECVKFGLFPKEACVWRRSKAILWRDNHAIARKNVRLIIREKRPNSKKKGASFCDCKAKHLLFILFSISSCFYNIITNIFYSICRLIIYFIK